MAYAAEIQLLPPQTYAMVGRPSPLLRTPEAAGYLGLSCAFLEKARVYGGGPKFAKLGRAVFYRQADLDAWIEARLRENTSQSAA